MFGTPSKQQKSAGTAPLAIAVILLMVGTGLGAMTLSADTAELQSEQSFDTADTSEASMAPPTSMDGAPGLPGPDMKLPEPAGIPEGRENAFANAVFLERNIGQQEDDLEWIVRGAVMGGVTQTGLLLHTPDGSEIRLDVPGATPREGTMVESLSHRTFVQDPVTGQFIGAEHAKRVRLADLLPGITLEVYLKDGALEYDFVIAPGADASLARLQVSGGQPALEDGYVVIGDAAMKPPLALQGDSIVDSAFVVEGGIISFELGDYNHDETLVIDPIIGYGSFIYTTNQYQIGYINYYGGLHDFASREDGSWLAVGGLGYPRSNPHITHPINPAGGLSYYPQPFLIEFDADDNMKYMAVWGQPYFYSGAYGVDVSEGGHVYVSGNCAFASSPNPCPGYTWVNEAQPIATSDFGYYHAFVGHFQWDQTTQILDVLMMSAIGSSGYEYPFYGPARIAAGPNGEYAVTGGTYWPGTRVCTQNQGLPAQPPVFTCVYQNTPPCDPPDMPFPTPENPWPTNGICVGYKPWLLKFDNTDKVEWLSWLGGTNGYYLQDPKQNYFGYEFAGDVAFDDKGNIYFTGSTQDWMLPTTPGAMFPCPRNNPTGNCPVTPIAGSNYYGQPDSFVGKMNSASKIEYLSYWGTTGPDYYYPYMEKMPIMAIEEDEVVFGGMIYGSYSSSFPMSNERPIKIGKGYYNGFLSHLDMQTNDLPLSFVTDSDYYFYISAVDYNVEKGRYLIAGNTYYPANYWQDLRNKYIPNGLSPVPQAQPGGGYFDGVLLEIDPTLFDPSDPADANIDMIRFGTYMGSPGQYDGMSSAEYDSSGDILIGGLYYDYYTQPTLGVPYNFQTTPNAVAKTPGNYNQLYVGRIEKAPPLAGITARDGVNEQSTPEEFFKPSIPLETLTWTDVWLEGWAIKTEAPIDWDTMRWELDGDGDFDDWNKDFADLYGGDVTNPPDPIVLFNPGTVEVCLRVDDVDVPVAVKTAEACMDIIFLNRPPVATIDILSEKPHNRVDPVWFDGSRSFDLDGKVDWTSLEWSFDGPGAGNTGSTTQALFQWDEVGTYEARLKMQDDNGDWGIATETIEIVNLAPTMACGVTAEEPQVGGWLEIAVSDIADRDGTIASWSLEPGDPQPDETKRLSSVGGTGAPPAVISTSAFNGERFTQPGLGTATLYVYDNEYDPVSQTGVGICTVDYAVGTGAVLADFTTERAPLWVGFDEPFFDNSFTPNGAIIEWTYEFGDGTKETLKDATHTYLRAGEYQVRLLVFDGFDADSVTKTVTVIEPPGKPMAFFTITDGPYTSADKIWITNAAVPGDGAITEAQWIIVGPNGKEIVLDAMPLDSTKLMEMMTQPGYYSITLRIIDENGWDVSETIEIIVRPPEGAVADFIASTMDAEVGELVTFIDASQPGPFRFVEWAWGFEDVNARPTGSTVEHTFQTAGTYVVSMEVVDESGERYFASHNINVVNPVGVLKISDIPKGRSLVPVADAGPDRTVSSGAVIRLDGSGSTTPSVKGLTYQWTQDSGVDVEAIGLDSAKPEIQIPFIGREDTVVFSLIVSDEFGVSAPDFVRLRIVEEGDDIGLVQDPSAAFKITVVDIGRAIFEAPQQDGLSTYSWDYEDGKSGDDRKVQHTYAVPKVYDVTLTVTDQHGRTQQYTSAVDVGKLTPVDSNADVQERGTRIVGIPLVHLMAAGAILGVALLGSAIVTFRRK